MIHRGQALGLLRQRHQLATAERILGTGHLDGHSRPSASSIARKTRKLPWPSRRTGGYRPIRSGRTTSAWPLRLLIRLGTPLALPWWREPCGPGLRRTRPRARPRWRECPRPPLLHAVRLAEHGMDQLVMPRESPVVIGGLGEFSRLLPQLDLAASSSRKSAVGTFEARRR